MLMRWQYWNKIWLPFLKWRIWVLCHVFLVLRYIVSSSKGYLHSQSKYTIDILDLLTLLTLRLLILLLRLIFGILFLMVLLCQTLLYIILLLITWSISLLYIWTSLTLFTLLVGLLFLLLQFIRLLFFVFCSISEALYFRVFHFYLPPL